MPQSQTAALPRPQEEVETDKSKQAQTEQTHEKHQDHAPHLPKRRNRNTKRTKKHKNKMTHGKTHNKSPRRTNHKATKSKTNTGTTAPERPVEQTTGGVWGGGGWRGRLKHFHSQPTSPWVPMPLLIQKHTKTRLAQTVALPRPQEEEETDKSKQAQIEQTYEKH